MVFTISEIVVVLLNKAGADPGFPVGGGANPPGCGRQHTILPNYLENCMKLRKFWPVGGRGRPGMPPWIRHCKVLSDGSVNWPHVSRRNYP